MFKIDMSLYKYSLDQTQIIRFTLAITHLSFSADTKKLQKPAAIPWSIGSTKFYQNVVKEQKLSVEITKFGSFGFWDDS